MPSRAVILSVLIVMVALCIDVSQSAKIGLYADPNHTGPILAFHTMRDRSCYDLDSAEDNRASAVNTFGNCFILFEHPKCKGRQMKVKPGEGCHANLKQCNFDDITSSYRSC
ncbi:unnamed protein product [Adineta steineri]|uniref:Uncharacterized protein n=1 Tax=Adineta steineri TaxID=433720 RepID=A0A814U1Z0_9BILA|nr:unnamed protein product [Adineta steineri]CAF1169011.1 unnamed protein product [Adineta steineri]